MSDVRATKTRPPAPERLELTARIRKLELPSRAAEELFDDEYGSALLLVKDSNSLKWAPRWLSQFGFHTTILDDFRNAREIIAKEKPDVILIEASIPGAAGAPLFEALQRDASLKSPIITLCSDAKEITAALDAGVSEIASKPFQWQAIANRAKTVWYLTKHRRLMDTKDKSLREAVELADDARQELQSRRSIEPVTGLPNKSKFMDLLQRGMQAIDRDKNSLAVFVVGFTRFRLVVEAMGQKQADSVLTEIGQNLADCLQTHGMTKSNVAGLRTGAVASLDQFRFGLMLTCAGSDNEHIVFQQKLFEALSKPVHVAGQIVHLSACLGVSLYPQDADDVDSLLQRADNAMHDAQASGGGYKYYCAETDAAAARKLKLEHLFHEALDRAELSLVYQPIVNVASGETVGAEALLRWRQADGSYIPPDEFIPIAEECGLMVRAGEFVLDQACQQFSAWQKSGLQLTTLCVNISKAQLLSNTLAQTTKRLLAKHEMQPHQLELEISERGVLSGDVNVIQQLDDLKTIGVRLSIDDFGTGDSAIAYLKDMPVDTLKIDRSYIANIAHECKNAALASAMVALGQRLELTIIAEGVETEDQLLVLRNLGCDAYQGFFCSEPVSAELFAARLAT